MAFLIQNERHKILATWLNNASLACFIAGVISPLAKIWLEPGAASGIAPYWFSGVLAMWMIAAACLHIVARVVLGRLRE